MTGRFQRISIVLALLLVCVAGRAGAQNEAAAPASGASRNGADTALEQAIRKRFAASRISANGFTVTVSNGIATLRGETAVAQHKGVATRLARLAGAKEVVNQITITEAGKQRLRTSLQGKGNAPPPRGQAGTGSVAASGDTGETPEEPEESPRVEASEEVPRFRVVPPSRRGEARSQRRRY